MAEFNTEIMEKSLKFVEQYVELLKDDEMYEGDYAFLSGKARESVEAAKEMLDSEEKAARMNAAGVNWARQLVHYLFDENLLTPEIEKEYRELGNFRELVAEARKYVEERETKSTEHYDAIQEINKINGDVDMFNSIMVGRSKEEAEARLAKK